ncbi:hypothetical protein [Sphingobium sp. MK2]|uniref:hypothetical protein n=1 Tax=Sphingobium sp. MK2 TaxID=3116540 RepID=UPI0032E3583A
MVHKLSGIICAVSLIYTSCANAQVATDSPVTANDEKVGQTFQDCSSGTPPSIIEVGPQASISEFGRVNQTIVGGFGAVGFCGAPKGIRWRFEASYSHVDDDFSSADAVVTGAGFTFRPISKEPGFTITPIARIGYENFSNSSNLLYGGSVTLEYITPFGTREYGKSGPSLQVILVERPEYISRQVVRNNLPVGPVSQDVFSNFASIGFDGAFSRRSRWRWKATLASLSIDSDAPTNQIFSLVLSTRPTTNNGASYPWSAEIWLSAGNGNYRGALFSMVFRFD